MAEGSNREVVDRFYALLNARRWDEIAELVDTNFVMEYPQSGERIQGMENARSVAENFPGLPTGDVKRVVGAEDKWVLTPMFSPLRITGTGDTYTVEAKTTYPNGELWHTVDIIEFRKGKISKWTGYFGPPFPPPEWRSKWVEKMDDATGRPRADG